MELSEFAFRIILLFIPGLIAFLIIDKLTNHKEYKLYFLFIYPLLLGFICYWVYSVFINASNYLFDSNLKCSFFNALADKAQPVNLTEVSWVSLVAIVIGFIFTYLLNRKVLNWLAYWIKASRKFGDVDIWSYLMNSKIPEWVVIRDKENDLMYEGWVHLFTDSTERDEIFLRDVTVFINSTGEELYEIPGLYLPRKRENLVIEFPRLEFTEYRERRIDVPNLEYRNIEKNPKIKEEE